jgi:uncharacterized protein YjbI with pentapeptide repeats
MPIRDLSRALETQVASSGRFNRLRRGIDEKKREVAHFSGIVLSNRDLGNYDVSDSRFFKCVFDRVEFGRLSNVEFSGCEFRRCRFLGQSNRTALERQIEMHISNVLFYECEFSNTDFREYRLKDVQFAKSRFVTRPQFQGSRMFGLLRIEKCGHWKSFIYLPDLDMRLGQDESFRTDMVVRSFPLANWETIRALQNLPFIQISLFGLVLLNFQVYILYFLLGIMRYVEVICVDLQKLENDNPILKPLMGVVRACSLAMNDSSYADLSDYTFTSMLVFLFLFLGALIHKTRCPPEISEFTRSNWVIDKMRPSVWYEILARRRKASIAACLLMYGTSLAIFCYSFISKVIPLAEPIIHGSLSGRLIQYLASYL